MKNKFDYYRCKRTGVFYRRKRNHREGSYGFFTGGDWWALLGNSKVLDNEQDFEKIKEEEIVLMDIK